MQGTREQIREYARLRSAIAPRPPLAANLALAFVVGGAICVVGQLILNFFRARGAPLSEASSYTGAIIVLLGALFTGFGLYDELTRAAGMGAALPISGFANSIVAPAMEFKREGWILGVGARMFVIAGPVLVYGVATSFAVGALKLLAHLALARAAGGVP
jgi:stage V sporulation protein AC